MSVGFIHLLATETGSGRLLEDKQLQTLNSDSLIYYFTPKEEQKHNCDTETRSSIETLLDPDLNLVWRSSDRELSVTDTLWICDQLQTVVSRLTVSDVL